MPDDAELEAASQGLDTALDRAKGLEERMKRGEHVAEEEMSDIARQIAASLEGALDALKSLLTEEKAQEENTTEPDETHLVVEAHDSLRG